MALRHAESVAELAQLQAHATTLEDEVAHLKSTKGIEEEIRDRFDVVKEGEKAVIVIDEKGSTTSPPVRPVIATDKKTSWSFLTGLFFWR